MTATRSASVEHRPDWRPTPAPLEEDRLIVFDGVCVLCSAWVRFIVPRDIQGRFRLLPIQTRRGRALAAAFGINPVHLGVVFLANLELGFLFPPVGLNLFLSSSRFSKPLPQLYRHVVPFLIILGIGVLVITYVPWMSLGILRAFGK